MIEELVTLGGGYGLLAGCAAETPVQPWLLKYLN